MHRQRNERGRTKVEEKVTGEEGEEREEGVGQERETGGGWIVNRSKCYKKK